MIVRERKRIEWETFDDEHPHGEEDAKRELLANIRHKARDNARTPMQVRFALALRYAPFRLLTLSPHQWDSSPNAGFTTAGATPWMRIHDDYDQGWNVESQQRLPDRVWSFWQRLLALRKQHLVLVGLLPLARPHFII